MMELFSEIYGCYYHVVGQILQQAHGSGLTQGDIDRIVGENAFSESGLHLIPRLLSGKWDLLRKEDGRYYSKLAHRDTSLPLTTLQKAWLKALLKDRRIRLFLEQEQIAALEQTFADVEPLFDLADFHTFDAATDNDNYGDEAYICHFRLALDAIKEQTPLFAQYEGGKARRFSLHFLPTRMLYSAKDDKFRIVGVQLTSGQTKPVLLNMARVRALAASDRTIPPALQDISVSSNPSVTIAITDERNALERCMLQFASYNKQTTFQEETGRYLCEIFYDPMEETELLIRILSFGPAVEVLGPASFLQQIKERVRLQVQRMVCP